jgi:hypothetical protein
MSTCRLILDLDLGAEHPSGWLQREDLPPRHFDGYVQLISALQQIRSSQAPSTSPGPEPEGCDERDST